MRVTASRYSAPTAGRSRARRLLGEVLLWSLFCTLAFFAILLPLGRLAPRFVQLYFARAVTYSVVGTAVTAPVIELLARRPLFRRFPVNVLAAAVVLVACALVSTLLGLFVNATLGIVDVRYLAEEFAVAARFGLALTLVVGGAGFVYESLRGRLSEKDDELRARELTEARALALAAEARLSALAARIHPHFLFNTLNSIAALIPEDPRRAETMVEGVARLLRTLLDADTRPQIPLRDELASVRAYLELEKVRFGERLDWRIELPPALEGQAVPPLALQALAENCVKHAVAQRRAATTVCIDVVEREAGVVVEVADDGPGFVSEALRPGHGLAALGARLDTLYGSAGRLEIGRRDERTVVRLFLPRRSVSEEGAG